MITMAGRILISVLAVLSAGMQYYDDLNHTHMFNAGWTGHAKYHDAITILLATALCVLALIHLWVLPNYNRERLTMGTLSIGAWWLALAGAMAFPGTTHRDPEFRDLVPHIGDYRIDLRTLIPLFLVLLTVGYLLELRALRRRRPAPA
ncbi:hypothetical protein D5S17_16945 [Pseudonocardiaceae bacterium YIM PH 21723]|nr:hypothetical protein D5S17_16945 [Pseudonocardiaceae bacterium YIM PH 21723]